MKEQRRCHRMAIVVPISFELALLNRRVETHTLDISATGFAFKTGEEVRKNDIFTFLFKLDEMKEIELEAQVAWVRQKWGGKYKEFYVGMKVVDEINQGKIEYVQFVVKNMFNFFGSDEKS